MEEEKFYQEFKEITKSRFEGIIKLSSATYYESRMLLHLDFIADANNISNITDEDKDIINSALNIIFQKTDNSAFKFEYEIHSTFADKTSIMQRIARYFRKTNETILRFINEDNVSITLNPYEIEIEFSFITPIYLMFTTGNIAKELKSDLEHSYIPNFLFKVDEVKGSLEETISQGLSVIETTSNTLEDRTVKFICKDKLYSIFKIMSITKNAKYIIDAKVNENPNQGFVDEAFCGKITNYSIGKFKNKNYDPNDVSKGPEEKYKVNFILDDTTGKLNCVAFPKNEPQLKALNLIHEGEEVVCLGSLKNFEGKLSYAISAIFNADIDYDSIVLDYVKPTPKRYKVVFPKPFKYDRVASLIEQDTELIDTNSEFFKNKTFVIFDIECTGKNVLDDEIIEISAIKVVNGEETESWSTLINPKIHIPDMLTEKIHHISDDMVKNQPTIDEVIDDFYLFTRDAILVGHNIDQFDYPFVNKYMQKAKYKFDNQTIDTLVLSRKFFREETDKFDLTSLTKHFGLDNDSPHRGFTDTLVTYDILKILGKRISK